LLVIVLPAETVVFQLKGIYHVKTLFKNGRPFLPSLDLYLGRKQNSGMEFGPMPP
jgi:hypothetical protein